MTARRDPLDQVEARVSFHGGAIAVCRAGRADRADERLVVRAGKRAFELRAGSDRARPSGGTARAAIDLADGTVRRLTADQDSLARSHERQLEAFVAAVRARTGATPGTTDGLAAMLAGDAARQSLQAGAVEAEVSPTPTA